MYKVVVTIQAKNPSRPNDKYKKAAYDGIVLPKPKKDRMSKEQIDCEIKKKLIDKLCEGNPNLTFTYKIVSIERIGKDFCFKEGED